MPACPECGFDVDDNNPYAEINHMEDRHPEVIARRMLAAGFELRNGKWINPLASEVNQPPH